MFNKLEEIKNDNAKFKKKMRRKAEDIPRSFVCPAGDCFRSYGSELALKVHIKKKHPEGERKPNLNSLRLEEK